MGEQKAELSTPSPAALLAFVHAVELGSFASAARRLEVSAPAIGQHVARLERAYGVRLLERSTRRMSPTPEGRVLFERARAILGELGQLGRLFDERDGALRGHVRVSAPAGIARRVVASIVARFLALHPEVHVSLDASDTLRDLGGDAFDVAVRILPPVDSSVVAIRIARLVAVTVASPAYLARRGTPRHPSELAGHELIAYRHPGTGHLAPFWFRTSGRDAATALSGRIAVNDVDVGARAAELGVGIAQPPSHYALEGIESGRLVSILDAFRATPWTLYLCHAGGRALPRRVRAFVDFARVELKRQRWSMP